MYFRSTITGGKSTPQKSTQQKKNHRVPDSHHREEGESSRELFEKVRANAVVFAIFGILGGFLGL